MRVCAERDSEYYNPDYMGSQVWCNGKLISRVIEADDEAGWVIRDQEDENGNVRVDRMQQCALREILRGRVSIVNPRLLPVLFECEHQWEYRTDSEGDPDVINGMRYFGWYECPLCGATDNTSEPPDCSWNDY